MTRRHQLETTLRTLKLSGMLDTLEARVVQARAGELGHLEFLQVLCEDEIARRDATAIARRIRQARFEQQVTLEDFDFSYNPKIPAAHFRDLATLRFVTANEAVILPGPVGVGKTHLAQALAHQACWRGHSAAFTKTSRLLAGGHADRTWGARLRRWAKPDVLVLDDPHHRPREVLAGVQASSCRVVPDRVRLFQQRRSRGVGTARSSPSTRRARHHPTATTRAELPISRTPTTR